MQDTGGAKRVDKRFKPRPRLTPADAMKNWAYWLEARFPLHDRNVQEKTLDRFFGWYLKFRPRVDWTGITHSDILQFLRFRQEQRSYRENTIWAEVRALGNFFKFLVEEKAVAVNPMEGPIALAWARKAEPRVPLTDDEVGRLREAITAPVRAAGRAHAERPAGNCLNKGYRSHYYFPQPYQRAARDWAMFELLYETGIRLEELMSLALQDIDLGGRTLHIRMGKGRKERRVFFSRGSLLALQAYLPLFINRAAQGRPGGVPIQERLFGKIGQTQVRTSFKKYARKAGIDKKVFPHIFRHGFITRLHAKTGNLPVIQRLAGHASALTTAKYIHPTEEYMEKVYRDAFETAVGK